MISGLAISSSPWRRALGPRIWARNLCSRGSKTNRCGVSSAKFRLGANSPSMRPGFLADGTAMVRRRSLERKRERLLSRIAEIGRASSAADAETLNDLLYEKKSLDYRMGGYEG